MATLEVGRSFSTWEEVFKAVEEYSEKTLQPFIRSSSKLCSTSNKHLKPGCLPYPEEMKYSYYTFLCRHGGTPKWKENITRKRRKSEKYGCHARIHAAINRKRTGIEITVLNTYHSHVLSSTAHEIRKLRQAYYDRLSGQTPKKVPKPDFKTSPSQMTSSLPQSQTPATTPVMMIQGIPQSGSSLEKITAIAVSSQPSLPSGSNCPTPVVSRTCMDSSSSSQTSHGTCIIKTEPVSDYTTHSQPEFTSCISHSCRQSMESFLSFLQRKDEEDRRLREKEIALRQRECALREKEIEFLKQRFEMDKLERQTLLDLLKTQQQILEQKKQEPMDGSYTIVLDNSGQ